MSGVQLWGWDATNKVWREIIVNGDGKIEIGSVADAEISQDTPQSLKHVPHGYYAAGGVYKPLAVDADGKLLLQIAAAPDPFSQLLEFIPWVSRDGLSIGGDAGHSISPQTALLSMATGSTANFNAYARPSGYWRKLIDAGKIVTVEFIIWYLSNITDQNLWLRMAYDYSSPPTEIHDHLGWKIIGADLYASNADGAAQTITDTGVDLLAGDQLTRLKMIFTPGTDIKFYVNDALVATHTTNLPAQTMYTLDFHIRTLTNGRRTLYLGRVLMQKQY